MITWEYIFNQLNDDQKVEIRDYIENGMITKNQATQIFINAFETKNSTSHFDIKSNGYKLNRVLFTIQSIINSAADSKNKESSEQGKARAITRMMKKDIGIEAINEMLCHLSITQFFSNYYISPLFMEGPDGYIKDESLSIPVEIKSRFPKILLILSDFFSIVQKLPCSYPDLTIFLELIVTSIGKFTETHLLNEVNIIKSYFNDIFIDNIQEYDIERQFSSEYIEYTIKISLRKATVTNFLGFTTQDSTKYLTQFHYGQQTENGLVPKLIYNAGINEVVNQQISSAFFKGFFKNSENHPKEPRILAFFSNYWKGELFDRYIHECFANYIKQHNGTMIIGIIMNFSHDSNCKMGVKFQAVGNDIKKIIKKYYKGKI